MCTPLTAPREVFPQVHTDSESGDEGSNPNSLAAQLTRQVEVMGRGGA